MKNFTYNTVVVVLRNELRVTRRLVNRGLRAHEEALIRRLAERFASCVEPDDPLPSMAEFDKFMSDVFDNL